ncbi:MAG TPA: hypothetical protein VMD30_03555 [Tepidisphaeraceae bacterium]|nr:hypothetical protein [Tepidisphaeraceae bacterium]
MAWPRKWIALPILLGVLCTVYCMVLLLRFGVLDDYSFLYDFHYRPRGLFGSLASQGRPLNELLLWVAFSSVRKLRDLWEIRLANLVVLAGMAWLYFLAMNRAGWKRGSLCFVVILCTVPAITFFAAQASAFPIAVSGLCAVAAGLLATHAFSTNEGRWSLSVMSGFLLLISTIAYQPTAMLFWPTIALDLFPRADNAASKRALCRFGQYACIALPALFAGWIVYKWGVHEFPKVVSAERNGFVVAYGDKLRWFFREPAVDVFSFPGLRPSPIRAVVVAFLLVPGLLLYFGKAGRAANIFLAIILLPLAYLPNLLTKTDWATYRTQAGFCWTAIFLAWLAAHGYWRLGRRIINNDQLPDVLLLLATAWCCAIAAWHVTDFIAWPQSVELAILKTALADPRMAAAQRIIVLQPRGTDTPAPFSRYDEFGVPSVSQWTPKFQIALIQLENDSHARLIPVESRDVSHADDPIPPGSEVIDMRILPDLRQ